MKTEVINVLGKSWKEINRLLVNKSTVYIAEGQDLVFIIQNYRDDTVWIAYFNPDNHPDGTVHGSLTECDHQSWHGIFNSNYGMYDASDWNHIRLYIKSAPTKETQTKIASVMARLNKPAGEIQLGVELELERAWSLPANWLSKRLKLVAGALIDSVVSDTSVRGGMELRFNHPKLANWNKDKVQNTLKYLKNKGYNHWKGTAGMHIHMSAGNRAATWRAATWFMENIDAMKEILYPICARQPKVNGSVRTDDTMHRYGVGKDITRGFTGHNTLEIRCFEATTNPEVFYARLKFADYLMRFLTEELPVSEFFNRMSLEDKLNYKLLVETDNPHAFGCGKQAALAKLNLGV